MALGTKRSASLFAANAEKRDALTTQFSICVVACAVHMNARSFWTACNTALN